MIYVLETLVQISARTVAILTDFFLVFLRPSPHSWWDLNSSDNFLLGITGFLEFVVCHLILLTLKHTVFQRILDCFHLKVNG